MLLMERGGRWWWLYAWVGWTLFSLALTWAYPRFIAPLFNRFSPLTDEALKSRVEQLLERCGFASKGVFVMDGSRRSGSRQRLFHGRGPQQAHRVLRHAAGAARRGGSGGRAGA